MREIEVEIGRRFEILRKEMGDSSGGIRIEEIGRDGVIEMQRGLRMLGYGVGEIDGIVGSRTREMWREFKEQEGQGSYGLIGGGSVGILEERVRGVMGIGDGGVDYSNREEVVKRIVRGCDEIGLRSVEQKGYVVATVEHETNGTFRPVLEAYWLSEEWRRRNLRYHPFVGRGYVQITWSTNYRKYSELIGIDLVKEPDLTLVPEISMYILLHGCKAGEFTGRKLEDYIDKGRVDLFNARRVINGLDRAGDIAKLARQWIDKLI